MKSPILISKMDHPKKLLKTSLKPLFQFDMEKKKKFLSFFPPTFLGKKKKKRDSVILFFSSHLCTSGSPLPAEIQVQTISLETPNVEHRAGRWNPTYTKRAPPTWYTRRSHRRGEEKKTITKSSTHPPAVKLYWGMNSIPDMSQSCHNTIRWEQMSVEKNGWAVS